MSHLLLTRTRRGHLRVGVRLSPDRVRWFRGRTATALLRFYDTANMAAMAYRSALTAMGHTADDGEPGADCPGCVALWAVREGWAE